MKKYLYIMEDGVILVKDKAPSQEDLEMIDGGYLTVITAKDGNFYDMQSDGSENLVEVDNPDYTEQAK